MSVVVSVSWFMAAPLTQNDSKEDGVGREGMEGWT